MGDLFASIKQGLEEAITHQKGEKTGLTQEQFAATFGISLGTLRHWERGDRRPHGPALVLLNAVAKEPGTVLRILTGERVAKRARGGKEKVVSAG